MTSRIVSTPPCCAMTPLRSSAPKAIEMPGAADAESVGDEFPVIGKSLLISRWRASREPSSETLGDRLPRVAHGDLFGDEGARAYGAADEHGEGTSRRRCLNRSFCGAMTSPRSKHTATGS